MSVLTKEFLESIGISLDDDTYLSFTTYFDETLSTRIIDEIIDELDENQLSEFEKLKDSNDDQLWQWVNSNIPNLSKIIQDEVDILLGDVAENSDNI